jgi:hypothetical protein
MNTQWNLYFKLDFQWNREISSYSHIYPLYQTRCIQETIPTSKFGIVTHFIPDNCFLDQNMTDNILDSLQDIGWPTWSKITMAHQCLC